MTLNQLNCQFFNVNGFVRLVLLLLALKFLMIRAGHLTSSRTYKWSAARMHLNRRLGELSVHNKW